MGAFDAIVKARKAKGWSQAELGKRAGGISQPAIKKIEAGQTRKSKYLPDIARALDLPLSAIDPGFAAQDNAVFTSPQNSLVGERNLPVFASAEGGGGAIILSSEPVDFVRRPAPLAEVKDGYGIIVVLDSMEPEFRPGDTALVNPHLQPIRGEACVVYSDDGHGMVKAVIKSFVSANATHWVLEQWNPRKTIKLARKEWAKCHRIVGKYSRR